MYQFSYHAIAPFVSHLISISVFLFVVTKNPHSRLHLTLGIFCFFASLWQFGTGMMFMAQTDKLAIFWDRIVYIGVNFMWVTHFHFSILFSKSHDKRNWLIAGYAIALFYACFIFSNYLVHDLYRYAWGCHTIAGPLHHSFVLISTGFYIKSLYLIFRSYTRTTNEREKIQYKYYFVGFTIYVSATLAYLPAYEISVYPVAYWFGTIYCIILVYIIVKHRMLDIETVIHKTLLWMTTSAALLVPAALAVFFAYPYIVAMSHTVFFLTVMVLIILMVILYAVIQPKIDVLFQRKKYNYRSIINAFMDKAVTINDKTRLARITENTIRKSLYTEQVRCFFMHGNTLIEAGGTKAEDPERILLSDDLIAHIVQTNDLMEHDFIISDPVHEAFKAPLMDFFHRTQAYLAVPVVHEARIRGIVTLAKKINLKAYTAVEKQFLKEFALGISVAIINSMVFETQKKLFEKEKEARKAQDEFLVIKDTMNKDLEMKVKARTQELTAAMKKLEIINNTLTRTRDELWGEMALAKKIQTILLPRHPVMSGYEITAYTAPADEMGGDYYDVVNTQGTDWIVIGDVSGHGISAGLIMMMAQTAIHTALGNDTVPSPKKLLQTINESLFKNIRQMNEDKYMTMTVLAAHENGRFTFSGLHQDILVFRRDTGVVEAVQTEGIWIGIHSPIGEMLTEQTFTLNVGDAMLLYTDGITESWGKKTVTPSSNASREMLGDDNLQGIFEGSAHRPVEEIKNHILHTLSQYECDDDVTFMIIKRTT